MCFHNCINYRIYFFAFCLINKVFFIHTAYRFIGRDLNNVHTINIAELLFFSQCCTCHTRFFLVLIKEVLESNRCKRLALTFYFNTFFRFNSLMKTIGITTSRHNTSGELINDKYLIIFYHIIMISVHKIMCAESQNNIMLDLKIFCVCQVLNVEEFLNFLYTIFCERNILLFLIDNIISGLNDLFTHNGCHLGHLAAGFTLLHLTGQNITCPV